MTVSVLVVDDQNLVRQGIISLLQLDDRVQVIGEAASGDAALTAMATCQPDVVLMDIRMPGRDGIATVEAMKQQGFKCPVIMLTTFDDHQLILKALEAGAKGYLLKDVSLDILINGILAVANGETLIHPTVTERILSGLQGLRGQHQDEPLVEPLSSKEIEILRLLAAGCSNREIAEALFKSEGTVKNQVSTILAKLGVRDRTRAVIKAIESGLI
ncbi:DNA-binding response regulator [Pseudidiomarina aestuarii]|uniref:DNA-binding response regulator n=1 Tax=Pseudidiomarina aestuarii TaxID=624146 RepID=A0A7Z7ESY4_9GAMM|nr:response regulator transcription factor [Pseudidiomarina aestuarii]RUO39134.1 DNA-binding response regulator [Pseudidiomarina aestuarii]